MKVTSDALVTLLAISSATSALAQQVCVAPLTFVDEGTVCGPVVEWPESASRVSCGDGTSTCGVFSGIPIEHALVGPCLNGGAIDIDGDVFEVVFAEVFKMDLVTISLFLMPGSLLQMAKMLQ